MRLLLLGAVLLAIGLLVGCEVKNEEPFPVSVTARKIIPTAAEAGNQAQSEHENASLSPPGEIAPKVTLQENEALLTAVDVNLDIDSYVEQVVVLRVTDVLQNPIKLIVADYDSTKDSYIRSWEALVGAENPSVYDLQLQDLVGDHMLEIVFWGRNRSGEHILDVYRKSPGTQLRFYKICALVSDGTIDVEVFERPASYRSGQTNGPSFPIVALMSDPESDNLMDLVKHSYEWVYQEQKYVLSSIEKVPGKAVESQQLRRLYSSRNPEIFAEFLEGAWYHQGSLPGDQQELIFFEPNERRIHLYAKTILNVLIWQDSYSTLYNRLLVVTRNESIPAIKKHVSVIVNSYDEIEVAVQGPDRWDYSRQDYTRVKGNFQGLYPGWGVGSRLVTRDLSGLYKSFDGIELVFEPPYFTWISQQETFSGGFVLFNLGEDILELEVVEDPGLIKEHRAYVFEYAEQKDAERVVRTITLTPCRLSVHGVEVSELDPVTLEQVEFVDNPS